MPRISWKLLSSGVITAAILALAYLKREWIGEAFGLLGEARPALLALAFGLICLSYLVSAQVFNIVLRSLGYRMSMLRLWATALVAIVVSQSVPAGGVGSYAFLMSNFTRRGVPPGESALIASLETLSYVFAMLLFFGFSLLYLPLHGLAMGQGSYLAAAVALLVVGGALFALSRPAGVLRGWLHGLHRLGEGLLRRRWSEAWAERVIDDLIRARSLLTARRRDVVLLAIIQLAALSGHSLAMLVVLHALGSPVGFPVVAAAFGIALITSTFNVLPGGGGTVETALVAVLTSLGAGPAAIPAAVIFRLFNFWLMAPVAAVAYHWLMHEEARPLAAPRPGMAIRHEVEP